MGLLYGYLATEGSEFIYFLNLINQDDYSALLETFTKVLDNAKDISNPIMNRIINFASYIHEANSRVSTYLLILISRRAFWDLANSKLDYLHGLTKLLCTYISEIDCFTNDTAKLLFIVWKILILLNGKEVKFIEIVNIASRKFSHSFYFGVEYGRMLLDISNLNSLKYLDTFDPASRSIGVLSPLDIMSLLLTSSVKMYVDFLSNLLEFSVLGLVIKWIFDGVRKSIAQERLKGEICRYIILSAKIRHSWCISVLEILRTIGSPHGISLCKTSLFIDWLFLDGDKSAIANSGKLLVVSQRINQSYSNSFVEYLMLLTRTYGFRCSESFKKNICASLYFFSPKQLNLLRDVSEVSEFKECIHSVMNSRRAPNLKAASLAKYEQKKNGKLVETELGQILMFKLSFIECAAPSAQQRLTALISFISSKRPENFTSHRK